MNRRVPALDAVHRIEHGRRNERRIATPDLGIASPVGQGDEHMLVPIGHFIGADRAGQDQRQHCEQQAPPNALQRSYSYTNPFELERGLRYNEQHIVPARRPSAGAVPGR